MILYQTEDMELKKKIIGEDLSYVNTIKYGLAFEQGQKKGDEIRLADGKERSDTRVTALEEQVRQLQSKGQKKKSKCRCETT